MRSRPFPTAYHRGKVPLMNADTLNRILATVEQRSDIVGTGQGMQTVVGGGGVHSFGDDSPLVGFWAKIVARIETLEGPFIPSYTWTQVIEQGDGSFFGDPDTENYAIGGPGVDHADGQQLLDANTPRLPAFEINGQDVAPGAIVRMYWGGGPWLYFAATITELPPFVSNVCPIFGIAAAPGGGTIHVVTAIKVEYTYPDGSAECVTNPTGCCPGSGTSPCCPGVTLPNQLCVSITMSNDGCSSLVGSYLLTRAGTGWLYSGPSAAFPFEAISLTVDCNSANGIWTLGIAVATAFSSFVPLSGVVCEPFSAHTSIDFSEAGECDGGTMHFTVSENLAPCTGSGSGGCTGGVFDTTHPSCCPGICWPDPLMLTISGPCTDLVGTYAMSLTSGVSEWSSTSFTYNLRPAVFGLDCVDASGGYLAGMRLAIFYTDDNTSPGFGVEIPTCTDPPSVSGTFFMDSDGGACDGLAINWSITS